MTAVDEINATRGKTLSTQERSKVVLMDSFFVVLGCKDSSVFEDLTLVTQKTISISIMYHASCVKGSNYGDKIDRQRSKTAVNPISVVRCSNQPVV